jgi:hypothetical protein
MRCQTFNAPLGVKPVMTLLGSVQTTTSVVVLIDFPLPIVGKFLHHIANISLL